jgi:hypothetical protein
VLSTKTATARLGGHYAARRCRSRPAFPAYSLLAMFATSSRHHPAPKVGVSITTVETAALRALSAVWRVD